MHKRYAAEMFQFLHFKVWGTADVAKHSVGIKPPLFVDRSD